MTLEELKNDSALAAKLEEEMKALAAGGMEPAAAEAKVLKDHGIELGADALRAAEVEKIRLDDEALEQVSGGGFDWCVLSHSCFTAYCHDEDEEDQACWSDYLCVRAYHLTCDTAN